MKYRCEKVTLPGGAVIDHRLNRLDRNYALTATGIGVSYIFSGTLNVSRLRASLETLLLDCPVLAGSPNFKTFRVERGEGYIPLEILDDVPGRAEDFLGADQNVRDRAKLVLEPTLKQIRKGRAPVMCVRLTRFSRGGCALGVTINHAVADSKGFHLIMKQWSEIFAGRGCDPVCLGEDIFGFATDRPLETLLQDIEKTEKPRPQNYGNLSGRMLKSLIYFVVDKLKKRDRELIHLTPDQVETLRGVVRRETGLPQISRNTALSAHILHALIPLQVNRDEKRLKLANVVNIRDRVRGPQYDKQARFAGNAIYLMMSRLTHKETVHHLSRSDIAKALNYAFKDLTEANIWRDMRNIVDSLNADHGYPGMTPGEAVMAVNNQSKFDVYDVDFGAGRPLRVIPQEVGDHIMIFPAADGGVEIYIRDFANRKRQKKLLEPEWVAAFKSDCIPVEKDLVAVA